MISKTKELVCFILVLSLVSCGEKAENQDETTRSSAPAKAAVGEKPLGQVEQGSQMPGSGEDAKPPVAAPSPVAPGGENKPAPPVTTEAASLEFFNTKVLPLVKAAPCLDCHADPRIPVIQKGGLAPQSYSAMFNLLKNGTGPNNNGLFNLMRNLVPHAGGVQCASETSSFCLVLQEWYKVAFGAGSLNLGRISDVSLQGRVSGYAGLATAPTTFFQVRLYLDGESGKGVKIGETTANVEGSDNSIDGPHAFALSIPAASIDNRPHSIYAYAVQDGKEVLLAGSPFPYTAFKAKGLGAVSFPNFASCNGCHGGKDYTAYYGNFLSPSPSSGGSPTNNTLYNKSQGGAAHSGGAYINLRPAIITWWCQEFVELRNPGCPP